MVTRGGVEIPAKTHSKGGGGVYVFGVPMMYPTHLVSSWNPVPPAAACCDLLLTVPWCTVHIYVKAI